MVLFAEVLVDWIKHAFITRFNELPVDVYRDYTISLAYDMAQTRQKHVSNPLLLVIDPVMVVVLISCSDMCLNFRKKIRAGKCSITISFSLY
jgi:hypothetical protein